MSAADLVREHGLTPGDLVVHTGAVSVELLRELQRLGCRVLRLDPNATAWDGDIDTLRTTLTPAVERLVRERYGSVSLLLADGVVVERGGRPLSRAA